MRTDVRSRLVALAVMTASWCLQAQTTKPRFEVASVRPAARTVDLRADPRWVRPGGAFSVTRTAVVNLMAYAYGLKTYQIIGGPDWMRGDVFAIDARAGREVPEDEAKAMLQSLLEDRFKLVFHMEQRDMRFRALVLANADGRLGPFMTERSARHTVNRRERGGAEDRRVGKNLRRRDGSQVADAARTTLRGPPRLRVPCDESLSA